MHQSLPVAELFAKAPEKNPACISSGIPIAMPISSIKCYMQANPSAGLSTKTRKWTQLIEKQRVEFDPQKRKELLYKVQEIAVDEAYWLYLYEGQYIAAMREGPWCFV